MVDEAQFKLAMSHFASGVTVVTTDIDGRRYGMTVASFASLSLRPPLVLVCIEKGTTSHDAFARRGAFAVNILGASQSGLSSRFASRVEDRFAGVETAPGTVTGAPLIQGSLVSIECTLRDQLDGGDHTIFVGEVVAITFDEGEPLVYYRSGYRELRS